MTHVPTDKTKKFVLECARARTSKKKIAEALNLDLRTLKKHYDKELKKGWHHLRRLATNKIVSFLEQPVTAIVLDKDGEPMRDKDGNPVLDYDKDLHAEQAKLAEKVMKSHGWKSEIDLGGEFKLPRVVIQELPYDEEDK